MSEIVEYIKSNKDLIDAVTTNKVNVSDIVNNLTTNVSNKPLSAAQGVAIKKLIDALDAELDTKAASEHTHAISEVTNLQSSLDNKSNIGHTHTVDNITDLTVTANELNYISGVTSNIQSQINGKANTVHTHTISEVINLQSSLDDKVSMTRTVNGKALSGNITLSASDVGADVSGSASSALSSANTYTDNAVAQKTQVQIVTWATKPQLALRYYL